MLISYYNEPFVKSKGYVEVRRQDVFHGTTDAHNDPMFSLNIYRSLVTVMQIDSVKTFHNVHK